MISGFGIVSLLVLIISVAAMILHFRLMQKRGSVDEAFDILEEALETNSTELGDALRDYDNAVAVYNGYIAKFPANFLALLCGLKKI